MNAHADMFIVVSTQRIKHTKGHLSLSCFGRVKFSGFLMTKTSANKRLLLCLERFLRGRKADIIPPTFPSVNHFTCKGSEKFADEQIFRFKVYSLKLRGKKTSIYRTLQSTYYFEGIVAE